MSVKIMPAWVLIYFVGYITFCLWSYISDLRTGKFDIWLIFDVSGSVCLLLSAIAYWYPQIYFFIEKVRWLLFIFGFSSNVIFAYRGFKKHFPDKKLSRIENIALGLFSTILIIILVSPLIWWGIKVIGGSEG
jgi:hypothetical protein